jgi:hypothetical protein
MKGGEIMDNIASNGGGVYARNGTFTMNGGEITSNTAFSSHISYGGGVSVYDGTFTMKGGEISDNTSSSSGDDSYGGGVMSDGTFTMEGGKITGNTASTFASAFGGGIYVADVFTMKSGEISDNTAVVTSTLGDSNASGGGVLVAGVFTMESGKITGNTASSSAPASDSSGGGVCVISSATFTMNGGEITGNTTSAFASAFGGGVYLGGGTFNMDGGEITGNIASSGGGVYFFGTFTMESGEIAGNTAAISGGGVYVQQSGTFTKTGGIIYGDTDATAGNGNATDNTAKSRKGHAVYVSDYVRRNSTAGSGITMDSSVSGLAGGWESFITGITYGTVSGSDPWILENDGRQGSPVIGPNGATKARVNFTSIEAYAFITIQLDVSSEVNYDYAFISALDNGDATYTSGYYDGSLISGTQSVTVTIPVPTAGSHFVDICYRKDNTEDNNSDRAWFKVIE